MSAAQADGKDLTNELLQALLTATDKQKYAALSVLKGQMPAEPDVPMPEPYLTLREVGRRQGISPCSLWRWDVPGHALGGRRRFRMSEVQAYLDSEQFKRRAEELKRERTENDS